jgi:predicted enzyme related to lactoylglutathione lyase
VISVRRIVADLASSKPEETAAFYRDVFGLSEAMNLGWVVTLAGGDAPIQLTIASEGGSGTAVPHLSIEVDDLDEAEARAPKAEAAVVHGPTDEPCGVRRFFLSDPDGRIVNVLTHQ